MGSTFILIASQALILAAPAATPQPQGARVSALASAEILRAATTRDDGAAPALNRHRRASPDGRITIEFE